MSDLSIHPIEYLKLHLNVDCGIIGKRLLTLFVPSAKKVLDLAERAAIVAVVFLTVGLILFACMQIGNSARNVSSYNNAISEMVIPSLQILPMGM